MRLPPSATWTTAAAFCRSSCLHAAATSVGSPCARTGVSCPSIAAILPRNGSVSWGMFRRERESKRESEMRSNGLGGLSLGVGAV